MSCRNEAECTGTMPGIEGAYTSDMEFKIMNSRARWPGSKSYFGSNAQSLDLALLICERAMGTSTSPLSPPWWVTQCAG